MYFPPTIRSDGFVQRLFSLSSSLARWGALATVAMGVLVSGLAGGSPAAGLERDQGSPVAAVDQATHDFGEVYEGEHLSHTFTVRNTGPVPLELRDPAAKAQNEGSEGNGLVAAALRSELGRGLTDFGDRAAISPTRLPNQTRATLTYPLLPPAG